MNALDSFLEILGTTNPDQEFLIDMHFDDPTIVPFEVAHIATDLVPQADKYVNGKSHIRIVGRDGASISEENYRWTGDLIRWADQGNIVQYLLLDPSEDAISRLKKEIQKLGECKGQLQLISIDPDKGLEVADIKLLERWKTFHFVSFENPKQLWVENFHATGLDAQGCSYFPPSAAEKSTLWSILTLQFDHIVSKYGRTILSAGEVCEERVAPAMECV